MREKDDQVERWAKYVKSHPTEWKRHMTPFLDSQINMANRFYKKLSRTKSGREKIMILKRIKASGTKT